VKRIVFAILIVLLLSSCATAASQPASEFAVEMNDFSFSPAEFTVSAGKPVQVTITNVGNVEHDFVIEKIDVSSVSVEGTGVGAHHTGGEHMEYDLHVSTSVNGTSVLAFTPNEPGTYKIFCSVEGHEVAGMVGELIVVPQ